MPATLRFGVLSTAAIGLKKVIPALQASDRCEVVAIASRDAARAQAAAERLHVPHAFGSYEELLAADVVDAVYVPLPNHLHVEWSIRALEAGKHVLCEKPIGLDAAEAQRFADAAEAHAPLKAMEAFMYRFHPQWRTAQRWVQEGDIGELRSVHAHFAYRNLDPGDVRNQADIGGGGLLDIGCYDVSLSRFLFGREPERVVATLERDPTFGTDRLVHALLDFGGGASATMACATQLEPFQRVQAFGAGGTIEIETPFNAPPRGAVRVRRMRDADVLERSFRDVDQYTLMGDAFAQAVLTDTPVPTPPSDAVHNMRVLDAIRESAERGAWVDLRG